MLTAEIYSSCVPKEEESIMHHFGDVAICPALAKPGLRYGGLVVCVFPPGPARLQTYGLYGPAMSLRGQAVAGCAGACSAVRSPGVCFASLDKAHSEPVEDNFSRLVCARWWRAGVVW